MSNYRRAFLFNLGSPTDSDTASPIPPPDADVLTLNRCSFGISSQQLLLMQRLGRRDWLNWQMQGMEIDDPDVDSYVEEHMPTTTMTASELAGFPNVSQIVGQLKQARLFRAMYSKRQLYEIMVEFWTNHFNIFHQKNQLVRILKTIDDREVIRKHALGNFGDLLRASSKSPAMLVYLDNTSNQAGTANENYARELMELHTLGVDGGYTEEDVQAMARCLTGWGVGRVGTPFVGEFRFYPNRHDYGEKIFPGLNITIPEGGGISDGETLVDLIATHPSTAHHIATKLVRYFVSDTPPESLIGRVAAQFLSNNGDIKSMLWEILMSDEFLSSADQKLKRPMEYIISAMRSTGVTPETESYETLRQYLYALGNSPFEWLPPDGYPDDAPYWASTNGLLTRWNFVNELSRAKIPSIRINYRSLIGKDWRPGSIVDHLADSILHRKLIDTDRLLFRDYLARDRKPSIPLTPGQLRSRVPGLISLMLSSDYFQYR